MNETPSPKAILQTLRIIHFAMLFMPLAFGLIVVFLYLSDSLPSGGDQEIFLIIPPIILVGAVPLSWIIFNQILKSALVEPTSFQKKISAYQTAHLIRLSLFEVAGLMAVVVCFITGNLYNLVVLGVVIIVFFMLKPSVYQMESKLQLTPEEKENLLA